MRASGLYLYFQLIVIVCHTHRRDHVLVLCFIFIHLVVLVRIILVGDVGHGCCVVRYPVMGPQGPRFGHLCGAVDSRTSRGQNRVCHHWIGFYGFACFGLFSRAWQCLCQWVVLVFVFVLIRQHGVFRGRGMCALSVPSTVLHPNIAQLA
jgi:hypothetical protein